PALGAGAVDRARRHHADPARGLVRVIAAAMLVGALLATQAQASAPTTPYSAAPTMKCLLAHHVLSSPVPAKSALPKGVTVSAVINAGFAMIPAQATDSATIFFAANPTAAAKVMARLIVYSVVAAAQVQGIDQAQARKQILRRLNLYGNAIVAWG